MLIEHDANSDLCVEGLYEAALATKVDAVESNEPVRGWNNFRHHRDLRKSSSAMSSSLPSKHQAMIAVDKDIGGSVPNALDNRWGKNGIEEGPVGGLLVKNLESVSSL